MDVNEPDRADGAHLGVVVVCYGSDDVICDCLESVVAAADADGVSLHIAVVDNGSPGEDIALVEGWQEGRVPYQPPEDMAGILAGAVPKPLSGHKLDIVRVPVNGGFAAGVNAGTAHLMQDPAIDRVWVLNPDAVVPAGTPKIVAEAPDGFGLLGGRIQYLERPEMVQSDGGWLNTRTGVTGGVNLFASAASAPFPAPEDLDFISGAHMVASRAFWDQVGPMEEVYFLYYEEVDWAWRRGKLPLAALPDALIYHRAGTSIGSATFGRYASPFALYFLHRSRHLFMARAHPGAKVTVWGYSLAKIAQMLVRRDLAAAGAIWRAITGAAPPASVQDRLGAEVIELLRSTS